MNSSWRTWRVILHLWRNRQALYGSIIWQLQAAAMALLLMLFTGWPKFLERLNVDMKPIACKNITLTGDLAFWSQLVAACNFGTLFGKKGRQIPWHGETNDRESIFASYPVAPGSRILEGGAAGHIAGADGHGWLISIDIGCAFISLDTLAQYYQIFGGEELEKLLDEMFEVFSSIDFVASSVQTHATLSALHGVLRYYDASKKRIC